MNNDNIPQELQERIHNVIMVENFPEKQREEFLTTMGELTSYLLKFNIVKEKATVQQYYNLLVALEAVIELINVSTDLVVAIEFERLKKNHDKISKFNKSFEELLKKFKINIE